MTNEEALQIIDTAIAEVEWEYPMEYAVAFELAKKALEKQIPHKHKKFKSVCECGHGVFPHMNYCDACGHRLEWV